MERGLGVFKKNGDAWNRMSYRGKENREERKTESGRVNIKLGGISRFSSGLPYSYQFRKLRLVNE